MSCEVTGVRHYSSDLPQGGLEVPCKLTFTASPKEIAKLKKLLSPAPSNETNVSISSNISITPSVTSYKPYSIYQFKWFH